MKIFIKRILHSLLGFNRYLRWFAYFKIITLKNDTKENDFFVFLDLLPEEGVALDIGANLGVMTYHLSKKIKKGKIFAFEPIETNYNVLRKICTHFKLMNVKLMKIALGENSGKLEMIMPVVERVKMHGLSHVKNKDNRNYTEGIPFQVEVKKLDDYLPEIKVAGSIKGIKLDAENYEFLILKGGTKLISSEKPMVYCELWDNQNREDCFGLMKSWGYRIFVNFQRKLVPFNARIHQTQNFFFIA